MRFVLLFVLVGSAQALHAQSDPGSGTSEDGSFISMRTFNFGPHYHNPDHSLSDTHDLPTERDRWMLIGEYPYWSRSVILEEPIEEETGTSTYSRVEPTDPLTEEWVEEWTQDGFVHFLDTVGFERTGMRVRTWVWTATPIGETPDGFDRRLTLAEFDCTRRTTLDLEDRTFRQGEFLGSNGPEWLGPAYRWTPETIGEVMGTEACKLGL